MLLIISGISSSLLVLPGPIIRFFSDFIGWRGYERPPGTEQNCQGQRWCLYRRKEIKIRQVCTPTAFSRLFTTNIPDLRINKEQKHKCPNITHLVIYDSRSPIIKARTSLEKINKCKNLWKNHTSDRKFWALPAVERTLLPEEVRVWNTLRTVWVSPWTVVKDVSERNSQLGVTLPSCRPESTSTYSWYTHASDTADQVGSPHTGWYIFLISENS